MDLRLYVDHDLCVSSGACVLERPDVFAYQDGPEQLAVVLPGGPELSEEKMADAVELCPVDAIRLLNGAGDDVTPA